MFERRPEISIVLTDLVMPNQEGIDAMRRRRPEVVIVAMSDAFKDGSSPSPKRSERMRRSASCCTLGALRQALALALAGAPLTGRF